MSAGALPQTPLGELTALIGLSGFKGPTSKGGEGLGEGEGRGEKGMRGDGRKGNSKGWFTPHVRNPEKYPDYRTDLIGGGGNADVCPGRQIRSRRHCSWLANATEESREHWENFIRMQYWLISCRRIYKIATVFCQSTSGFLAGYWDDCIKHFKGCHKICRVNG